MKPMGGASPRVETYRMLGRSPSPKAGEVDARERRRKAKPGDRILQVVVGDVRWQGRGGRASALRRRTLEHQEDRGGVAGAQGPGHGGHVARVPEVLGGLVRRGDEVRP